MGHCGCVPWDYPVPDQNQDEKHETPICDFYGSSCFNSYIENGLAEGCKKDCVAGCNEIKYSVSTREDRIDWEKLCSYDPADTETHLDLFEMELVKHIRNSTKTSIMTFQEALVNSNNTKAFLYRYCVEKLMYDIAIVEVVMDSPTVMKYIQDLKVTITDKLANFGEQELKYQNSRTIKM